MIFKYILRIDRTLTAAITLGQRGPGSNVNKGVISHFQELQKLSLTIVCSFVSHQEKEGKYFRDMISKLKYFNLVDKALAWLLKRK